MLTTIEASRSEDERWAAVCTRDAGADGTFVFAVHTTGVFCRPQCAASRPLRANVEFFETTDAARAAGYRACKRRKPDGLSTQDELVAWGAQRKRKLLAAESR